MKRGAAILCARPTPGKQGADPTSMVGDLILNHAERIIQTHATRSGVMDTRSLS
jgi:hypothetical protein